MADMDKEMHRKAIALWVEEAREMSPDNVAEYLVDKGLADYESAFHDGVKEAIRIMKASNSPYIKNYLKKNLL